MLGFKSLKNIGSSELSRFTANFARSSTCSLPGMPIWPGAQQKKNIAAEYFNNNNNYSTTPHLLDILHSHGLEGTRTVRQNQVGLPQSLIKI